ncbi:MULTISPECIES: site-specific tyrosine recombinase XerD [Persicobacter]|uniref:Tyrosine recombinase XerC n=1 Tax=Persicobacter diffluens TaxID=981 RepID=A0AAN4VZN7_9BACT|nr:site-specific tyrosine recombinase XerD [Persicobacter sp. CCB-QB2]GJM61652.1 tyrosine recombinase XerC [Persicobacter diffluens]
MNWQYYIDAFKNYLRLDRRMSENTVEAYLRDMYKLEQFAKMKGWKENPAELTEIQLHDFLEYLGELGMATYTQARMLSGIKAFYRYLRFENEIEIDPSARIDSIKLKRNPPEVLNIHEINQLLDAIDLSTAEGPRNLAILETLYSSGLRVSELINLKMNDIHRDIGFLRIHGKGNKDRLVPIGKPALKHIDFYLEEVRPSIKVKQGNEEYVFLNRRGAKLTRVMIFTIIKRLAVAVGMQKAVSPHTFRHSFATHLIEGGADLIAVQEMLGHESVTTTEIYTHLDQTYLKQIITEFHPRS